MNTKHPERQESKDPMSLDTRIALIFDNQKHFEDWIMEVKENAYESGVRNGGKELQLRFKTLLGI